MLVAAYILLLLAAIAGGLWLLSHIGPGWPTSVNDASEASKSRLAGIAIVLAAASVVCLVLALRI